MLTLMNGSPADLSGRQDRERRVYQLLDSLQIPFQRIDHEPADNMEACRAIDEALQATICKNLFLCNRQQTAFYLLMMPDTKNFKTKEISSQIGSARLSFGSAEKMEEYLDILPGAVSIMGLMNDREHKVQLLVDEDVLKGEWLGCHPCVNTSSLKLRTMDVFGPFLEAVGHSFRTVVLVGDRNPMEEG